MARHRQINQKAAVSVVFVASMFMNAMDVTIVNVAIPTLGRQFHVAGASVDTVVIGYLVSLAVVIPASGWLGDRLGTRRVLLAAIAVFTLSSALCGLATSLNQLVVFRVLQGVGGGMLTPVGMAMLYRTFPPAERVRAASILTVPSALGPALGPVVGGLLVTDLSWRWVFYVNLPIGLGAFIFGLLFLDEQPRDEPRRFDWPGFLLAGLGFGLLMYGVSEGPDKGWGSPAVVGTMAVGVVLIAALLAVERRTPAPMVDLKLFENRLFRTTNIVVVLTMVAFLGTLYLVSLFFQDGLGLSALASGLSTFPEALGVMLGAQVVTRLLYPVIGPRRLMFAGLVGIASTTALMSLIGLHTNLWWMRALMFALGYAMAHVLVSMQAAAFATIPPAATGRASMLFNAVRQLGSAVGVAVLSTVVITVGPTRRVGGLVHSNLTAYHAAFLTATAIALAASAFALGISDTAAAATMTGRRKNGRTSRRLAGRPVVVTTGAD